MRKLTLILCILLSINSIKVFAQAPESLNYQAVIRDNTGELVLNKGVDVRITIIDNAIGGETLYQESHNATTNDFGLVNLKIGEGNSDQDNFADINWGTNSKYLKVEIDAGDGFINLGTVQFVSVPYALYSNLTDYANASSTADNANFAIFADSARVAGTAYTAGVADALGSVGVYSTSTDTLFVVKDHSGNVVFAVFPDGAQIIVNETAKGKVGGFAVSGRSPSKAGDVNILKITADSTRIYVNDTVTAKGKVGGFAVSGRSPSKNTNTGLLFVTADSTRIYVNDDPVAKGKVGGFAVSGRSPSKSTLSNFLDLKIDNYFIGHESGINTTGINNLFLGYQSGKLSEKGNDNVMIGSRAGFENNGNYNVFLGYESGYSNIGGVISHYSNYNTFVGYQSGRGNITGWNNVYIGYKSGLSSAGSTNNVLIGNESGVLLSEGSNNVFIGSLAGWKSDTCNNNVFIGNAAGMNNTDGYSNLYIGEGAGANNLNNIGNVLLGNKAGGYEINGDNNVMVGNGSGLNAKGKENVLLGSNAGTKADYGNVMIGYRAGANQIVSNKLYIDNSDDPTPLIYGDFTADEVTINGTLYATTYGASDLKLKTNLIKIQSGLKILYGISAYYFNWNNYAKEEFDFPDEEQVGVIAQDVEKVLPQLVITNSKGFKAVDYSKLTPIVIEAIKEQQTQIEVLKAENEVLKQKLNEIIELLGNK